MHCSWESVPIFSFCRWNCRNQRQTNHRKRNKMGLKGSLPIACIGDYVDDSIRFYANLTRIQEPDLIRTVYRFEYWRVQQLHLRVFLDILRHFCAISIDAAEFIFVECAIILTFSWKLPVQFIREQMAAKLRVFIKKSRRFLLVLSFANVFAPNRCLQLFLRFGDKIAIESWI